MNEWPGDRAEVALALSQPRGGSEEGGVNRKPTKALL